MFAACGDSNTDETSAPEIRSDAAETVPGGSSRTKQAGPNSDPGGTPVANSSITTGGSGTPATGMSPATGISPAAGASQPTVTGDPATVLREKLDADFSEEEWYSAIESLQVDGSDALVLTFNNAAAGVDALGIEQACTALAGTVFGVPSSFGIEEVRVESAAGDVLATASGTQCDG